MIYLIMIFIGYLIGSIPSGVLVARAKGIHDITQYGSGNIGATNIGRILGLNYFFLVFFLDSLKAFLYVLVLAYYGFSLSEQVWASIALLCGNGYSIFLQGRGGKGVATSAGIMMALQPYLSLVLFGVWLLSLLMFRTVGIASICTFLSLPFLAFYWCNISFTFMILVLFMGIWGLWRHVENMKRYVRS